MIPPPGDDGLAAWTVRTDVFEGPLDLLLYLVRRDGIDLRSFPVRQVTDAYLETIERMRELHLGVAAEYLEMASTLCWLKSLELLPRPPALLEDEGEDPRTALVRRLAALQICREAASALDERVRVGRDTFVRAPESTEGIERGVASPVDAFGLLDLYHAMLLRGSPPPHQLSVEDHGPDIAESCRSALRALWASGGTGELGALIGALPSRAARIGLFVAVLEMARAGWIAIAQVAHLGPVDLRALVREDADLSALAARPARGEA